MSWISKIFEKITKKGVAYADTINGGMPVYSQFGQDIYASDVVCQAIGCIATEMSKVNMVHIRRRGNDSTKPMGNLQDILDNPNPLMSKSDFLEKMTWQLYFNCNAWAVPIFREWRERGRIKREYLAIYPIAPSSIDFLEDKSGTLFVRFHFANGKEATFPYREVIHVRQRFSVNEFMGGDDQGQPDHRGLLKSLQLNKDLEDGVANAMRASYAVNGVVKINTLMAEEEQKQAIKDFEKMLQESKSGILPIDTKSDFVKLGRDVKIVDPDTLKFVDGKILRHFGVSIPILTGDYTKAQYEAFYQKVIEGLVEKFGEAMTGALLTDQEIREGNQVVLYPKDLIFLSVDQTLEMVRLLGDSGTLYENEKREAFGLQPLKQLEGVRMQSLNYANVNIATKYQIKEKEEIANGKKDQGE